MQLNELVVRYRELATRTGEPVALTDFGLPKKELEKELAAFDEDYQISRFLRFTQEAEAPGCGWHSGCEERPAGDGVPG